MPKVKILNKEEKELFELLRLYKVDLQYIVATLENIESKLLKNKGF